MIKRISSYNIDLLIKKACLAQMVGFKIERPLYNDWFWRGYSIILSYDENPAKDKRDD